VTVLVSIRTLNTGLSLLTKLFGLLIFISDFPGIAEYQPHLLFDFNDGKKSNPDLHHQDTIPEWYGQRTED